MVAGARGLLAHCAIVLPATGAGAPAHARNIRVTRWAWLVAAPGKAEALGSRDLQGIPNNVATAPRVPSQLSPYQSCEGAPSWASDFAAHARDIARGGAVAPVPAGAVGVVEADEQRLLARPRVSKGDANGGSRARGWALDTNVWVEAFRHAGDEVGQQRVQCAQEGTLQQWIRGAWRRCLVGLLTC